MYSPVFSLWLVMVVLYIYYTLAHVNQPRVQYNNQCTRLGPSRGGSEMDQLLSSSITQRGRERIHVKVENLYCIVWHLQVKPARPRRPILYVNEL